jgi:peptidoglycan L-alanyl-D-glutamate endopeptidase CwlK
MPKYSKQSAGRLSTCDPRLQDVFNEVIKHFDCSVLQGHRGQIEQNECVRRGTSKLKWPKSKHNSIPSKAADVAPYPIDWSDRERFAHFAGFVLGIAALKGVKLRWGGDWNQDRKSKDERLFDGPHFEIIGD